MVELGIGVLVASCPCALELAVARMIAIILDLAKSGILFNNNCIIEKAKKITTVVFERIDTFFTRANKIDQHVVLSQNLPQGQDLGNDSHH